MAALNSWPAGLTTWLESDPGVGLDGRGNHRSQLFLPTLRPMVAAALKGRKAWAGAMRLGRDPGGPGELDGGKAGQGGGHGGQGAAEEHSGGDAEGDANAA